MPVSSEPFLDDPLRRLTRARGAHLRWLSANFGATFSDHEVEELLQDAYLRAMTSLSRPEPPQFLTVAAMDSWFRTVMGNTARDALRSRDGRTETARAMRPVVVPLTVDEEEPLPLAADDDVEGRVLAAASRDHAQVAVVRALTQLSDDHVRILRWRFMDNLEPRAIMKLERLQTLKAYEGRLTRAIKALGRALASVDLGVGCGEARQRLRDHPDLLLERSAGAARAHIDACAPCQAFQRRLRGALGVLPMPPLAASLADGTAGGTGAAGGSGKPGVVELVLSHPKLVAAVAAGALAGGGAVAAPGGDRRGDAPVARPAAAPVAPAPAVPYSDTVDRLARRS
jgi:RNA polymerase sigma factor (sigma-70 family)